MIRKGVGMGGHFKCRLYVTDYFTIFFAPKFKYAH